MHVEFHNPTLSTYGVIVTGLWWWNEKWWRKYTKNRGLTKLLRWRTYFAQTKIMVYLSCSADQNGNSWSEAKYKLARHQTFLCERKCFFLTRNLLKRNNFPIKEVLAREREQLPVNRNNLFWMETISCERKQFPVTGNNFM